VETVSMKNITVSVDDEIYHRARVYAAQKKTSLSALVKRFLTEVVEEEAKLSAFARLKQKEQEIRDSIQDFSASDRLSRDQIHEK